MRPSEVFIYIVMIVFLPITAVIVTGYVLIKYPGMCKHSSHDRENRVVDNEEGGVNNG